MKRRILSLVLAALLLVPMLPGRAAATSFTDVPTGSYYEEAVDWAVDQLITFGMSETQFAPDLPCNSLQTTRNVL